MCGNSKPQDLSPIVPQDQQAIEKAERDRWNHEHIHRSDPIRMIAKECLPTLRRWLSSFDHILGNAGLAKYRCRA
jgi:hypothetical protein